MDKIPPISASQEIDQQVNTRRWSTPTLMRYYCDKARHLVCIPYSTSNLHKMASNLGIKRCWFHKNHYDIPKTRVREITNYCQVVDSKTIVKIIHGVYGEMV